MIQLGDDRLPATVAHPAVMRRGVCVRLHPAQVVCTAVEGSLPIAGLRGSRGDLSDNRDLWYSVRVSSFRGSRFCFGLFHVHRSEGRRLLRPDAQPDVRVDPCRWCRAGRRSERVAAGAIGADRRRSEGQERPLGRDHVSASDLTRCCLTTEAPSPTWWSTASAGATPKMRYTISSSSTLVFVAIARLAMIGDAHGEGLRFEWDNNARTGCFRQDAGFSDHQRLKVLADHVAGVAAAIRQGYELDQSACRVRQARQYFMDCGRASHRERPMPKLGQDFAPDSTSTLRTARQLGIQAGAAIWLREPSSVASRCPTTCEPRESCAGGAAAISPNRCCNLTDEQRRSARDTYEHGAASR